MVFAPLYQNHTNAVEMPKTHIIHSSALQFSQLPLPLTDPLSNPHIARIYAALGLVCLWSKVPLWQDANHGQ